MKKTLLFVIILSIFLFSACVPGANMKEALSSNQDVIVFKNSHVDAKDVLTEYSPERFVELETEKYCLEELYPATYSKYELTSGEEGKYFILDENANIVCTYEITNGVIHLCNEEECGTQEELFLKKIIDNSMTKDRNFYKNSKEGMSLSWRIEGVDYVEYLNNELPGLGDEIKAAFDSIFPQDVITTEYFEMGDKVKASSDYSMSILNITEIVAIDNSGEKTLCVKKNDNKMYCGEEDDYENLSSDDFVDIYSDVFDVSVLEDPQISVSYERKDNLDCMTVETKNYLSRHNIYSKTSLLELFESMTDTILEGDSNNLESFSFVDRICLKNDIIAERSIDFELVSSLMAFEISAESLLEEIKLGVVTENDFNLPQGAITSCQTGCQEEICQISECSPLTNYECKKIPEMNCCGNDICEEGYSGSEESYKTCQVDCPGVSLNTGFKLHKTTDFIPKKFLDGEVFPGKYADLGGDKRIAFYDDKVATSYLRHQKYGVFGSIHVYDAKGGDYPKAFFDPSWMEEEYVPTGVRINRNFDDLKKEDGWEHNKKFVREGIVEYIFKDRSNECFRGMDSYPFISGIGKIYSAGTGSTKENVKDTTVWLEFGPCASLEQVQNILDEYVVWLTDEHTENDFNVYERTGFY